MIDIAIVDDVYSEIENIFDILKGNGECNVTYFKNPHDPNLFSWIRDRQNPSVVLLDLVFDGQELGETLLESINQLSPDINVFVFTSRGNLTTKQKYVGRCIDFIPKISVGIQDGPALLQKIKQASESGFKFLKEFSRIREMCSYDEPKAILELDGLLQSQKYLNLMAFKELNVWIKRYLEKGLGSLSITVPHLLLALDRSCEKLLQLQGDEQLDIMLDKCFALVHMGRQTDAENLLKKMVGMGLNPKEQGKRVLNLAVALSSFKNSRRSDARDIFALLDVNLPASEYEPVLEWLHGYNLDLWNQAINDYFDYWRRCESIDAKRILSLFSERSNASAIDANLLKGRSNELLILLYKTLQNGITGAVGGVYDDVTALFNCCKYIFQNAQEEWSVISDCDSICKNLNELSSLFYINGLAVDWIRFVDAQIANIGTTDVKVIRDVLSRTAKDDQERFKNLHQLIGHLLRKGETGKALEIVKEHEAKMFGIVEEALSEAPKTVSAASFQLFRFGELFEEYRDTGSAALYFEKAVKRFLIEASMPKFSKFRPDILYYINKAIAGLRKAGIDIGNYQADYARLTSNNVRISLPLDGRKIAIAGNVGKEQEDYKEMVKELEKSFGGEFKYWGKEAGDMRRLSSAISSGSIDIVTIATAFSRHLVSEIIAPAIERYNESQPNKVKLITVPSGTRGISGFMQHLKSEIER